MVEGACLLAVLTGRLGRRGMGLVGGAERGPGRGRSWVWLTRGAVRVPGPFGPAGGCIIFGLIFITCPLFLRTYSIQKQPEMLRRFYLGDKQGPKKTAARRLLSWVFLLVASTTHPQLGWGGEKTAAPKVLCYERLVSLPFCDEACSFSRMVKSA